MASQPLAFSLLLAASQGAVSASPSSPPPPRRLRATAPQPQALAAYKVVPPSAGGSSSNEDVPDARDRALRPELSTISQKCLRTMAASAENGKIKKDNYFLFTDGMSNGYYSFNNMTSYGDLPMTNKFGFVTLSCQCHAMGGKSNCCQGNRAKLVVDGIDPRDPESMPQELVAYVADICSVTEESIGENVLPPTGELPGFTPWPTASSAPSSRPSSTGWPTASGVPSSSPSSTAWPSVSAWPSASILPSTAPTTSPSASPMASSNPTAGEPTPSPSPKKVPSSGARPPVTPLPQNPNLSYGAWAGIAIAGAFVVTLIIYLLCDRVCRKKEEDPGERDLEIVEDREKERLAITADGEMDPGRPSRTDSPDATHSMSISDMDSIPSMSTKGSGLTRGGAEGSSEYYANNSLLPGRPDEESFLSSSDGPSFFTEEEEGVDLGGRLNSSGDVSNQSLDQAIESGNWEAVAASAAAIVKHNEGPPMTSPRASQNVETGVEV